MGLHEGTARMETEITDNKTTKITVLAVMSRKSSRTQAGVRVLYADTVAAVTTRIWLALVHVCNSQTVHSVIIHDTPVYSQNNICVLSHYELRRIPFTRQNYIT